MKACAILIGIAFSLLAEADAALVETRPATEIVADGAVLSGQVAAGKHAARVAFQYRVAGQKRWRDHTPWQPIVRSSTNLMFNATLSGLAFDTGYEARTVGIALGVRRYGKPVTFRTRAGVDVQTLVATNITPTNAVLMASVVP